VLLPLTLGVPFTAALIETHEQLLAAPRPFALIASPAFLKRLDENLPALPAAARHCRHILSAGGVLPPETARRAAALLGCAPTEIFGSTEAGAIAWRETAAQPGSWTPLPGVQIAADSEGRLSLRSPFLPGGDTLATDDQIHIAPDGGTFQLLGRLDRIVKIEEKRVALPEVERRLAALPGVADAAVVPLKQGARTVLGAVLALDESGRARLAAEGRGRFLIWLRAALREFLEPVALPRRLRFVDAIPANNLGKRATATLQALFEASAAGQPATAAPLPPSSSVDGVHAPSPASPAAITPAAAAIELSLPPDSIWFRGHFDGHPILPGVAQLHWAIHHAKAAFNITEHFAGVNVMKFKRPLTPGANVRLELRWHAASHRLEFSYITRDGATASSGKIIYAP
jgi:3-hydroxymyristoyl/3-hydroxydecanoyl-(acyl carrier protein) dehydratase